MLPISRRATLRSSATVEVEGHLRQALRLEDRRRFMHDMLAREEESFVSLRLRMMWQAIFLLPDAEELADCRNIVEEVAVDGMALLSWQVSEWKGSFDRQCTYRAGGIQFCHFELIVMIRKVLYSGTGPLQMW